MGLGKSATAIRAANLANVRTCLVLTPLVGVTNWFREWQKFSTFPTAVRIVSYSKLHEPIEIEAWDLAILDEMHWLKSPTASRTQKVMGTNGLLSKCKRIWGLSGTPCPNNASELWVFLFACGVTTLSYPKWVETYCDSYRWGARRERVTIKGTKRSQIPQLKTLMSEIMLRRMKSDVMDLPPLVFETVYVGVGPVDLEASQSFIPWARRENDFFLQLEKEAAMVRAAMEKDGALNLVPTSIATLRRYCGIQKVEAAAEMVTNELKSGEYRKIVIFAVHQEVIETLRAKLKPFGAVTIYGGTPQVKRQRHIDKFMGDSECKVLIGNIQACGTNINLTKSSQVLFVELDWVPGNNAQAAARCHRIGQEESVTVRILASSNPIDDKIVKTLERKTQELSLLLTASR